MCYCDTNPLYGTPHVHCDACGTKVEAEQAGPGCNDIDVIGGVVIDREIYCNACAPVAA